MDPSGLQPGSEGPNYKWGWKDFTGPFGLGYWAAGNLDLSRQGAELDAKRAALPSAKKSVEMLPGLRFLNGFTPEQEKKLEASLQRIKNKLDVLEKDFGGKPMDAGEKTAEVRTWFESGATKLDFSKVRRVFELVRNGCAKDPVRVTNVNEEELPGAKGKVDSTAQTRTSKKGGRVIELSKSFWTDKRGIDYILFHELTHYFAQTDDDAGYLNFEALKDGNVFHEETTRFDNGAVETRRVNPGTLFRQSNADTYSGFFWYYYLSK
jgi:hypothetical protein